MAPTWITPLLGNHLVAQLTTELVSAPPPSTLSNKKKKVSETFEFVKLYKGIMS